MLKLLETDFKVGFLVAIHASQGPEVRGGSAWECDCVVCRIRGRRAPSSQSDSGKGRWVAQGRQLPQS